MFSMALEPLGFLLSTIPLMLLLLRVVDPVRWTLACVADDLAYGAGVWRGCLAHRTWEPLRPTTRTSAIPAVDGELAPAATGV